MAEKLPDSSDKVVASWSIYPHRSVASPDNLAKYKEVALSQVNDTVSFLTPPPPLALSAVPKWG